MDFMHVYPVQVKQMDNVGCGEVDAFEAAMMRLDRKLGYFVGFDSSGDALFETNRSIAKNAARSNRSLTPKHSLN